MVQFTTTIQKFQQQGEKTGWTYITIPEKIAQQLKPDNRKSFRVKGKLDDHAIKGVALMPMGEGEFIMPLNATMRKAIGKRNGDKLKVQLTEDKKLPELSADLLECLADEPAAREFFDSLPQSHRLYFSRWIESAKTAPTKAKRIAQAVSGLAKKWGFSEMIRANKKENSTD
ncbi:MAG TPA: YdeI/OmpD-associated family protein [Chitinophagaceae bacterium]|nr:YdeI/OmpD-associated family protein [Chitinophagaceae bacterium]